MGAHPWDLKGRHRCPTCRTRIVMRDGDTLPVKNAILRVSLRSRGLASAKCLRRKRWVEVPLRYVS